MTERFEAVDRQGFFLRWEDGEFTSNWPPYLEAVKAMVDSKAIVAGWSTSPTARAATTPGWVAAFTAQEALRLEELDWDTKEIEFPALHFGYPPGSVA